MNYKASLAALVASTLLLSGTYAQTVAGDDWNEPGYKAVESYNFDLVVEADGKKLEMVWNKFEHDEELKWYKFVYSKTDPSPTYPENDALYLGDDEDMDSAEKWFKEGSYYVRLCAVTHSNGRYCSDVKKVEISDKYETRDDTYVCTQEYAPVCGKKDGKKRTYSNKCTMKAEGASYQYAGKCEVATDDKYDKDKYEKEEYKKEYKEDYKKTDRNYHGLSEDMKEKIEDLIENFIDKLEDKDYSDEKIVSVIDQIIVKLEKLKSNAKYKAIVTYMIDLLKDYQSEYNDDFGAIEDIFEGY